MINVGPFPRLKRGGGRNGGPVNHSPPFSAEVKSEWSYNSILPYTFMRWLVAPLPLPLLIAHNFVLVSTHSFDIRWKKQDL